MTLIKQPTPENISLAARNLKNGALIGLPTETVYGLAADAENENAVKRIYEVKRRPLDHPLIVHIASAKYLEKWAKEIPEHAFILAEKFWPGPMTLILKRSQIARDFVTGGQESIGIRVPRNQVALSVLKKFHQLGGNGLAAPSANIFGAVSPTDAFSVEEEIGHNLDNGIDFILNDGPSEVGVESTIIDCVSRDDLRILRSGFVTKNQIERVTKLNLNQNFNEELMRFPGGFKNHYSPKAKVVIDGETLVGDGFIALQSVDTPKNCVRLASPLDVNDFARQIYASLRLGDRKKLKRIYVVLPKGDGIAVAIRERILKASIQN